MISGVLIAIAGTLYGAYTDYKTGYVSDLVTHSMMALGVFLVLLTYPINQALQVFAVAAAVFAVGFLMYCFGQVGGGDVKLFAALALLVPVYPAETMKGITQAIGITPAVPPYPFILSVFILFSILFMSVISFAYIGKIRKRKGKIKDFGKKSRKGIMWGIALLPLAALWLLQMSRIAQPLFAACIFLIFVPIAASLFIIPFKEDIIRLFFAQKKEIAKLDDDDVLALELIDERTKKKLGLWRKTFTNTELNKIKALAKKLGIKTITVCENMPRAVPYIFAALIVNLIFGDFLLWLMTAGL